MAKYLTMRKVVVVDSGLKMMIGLKSPQYMKVHFSIQNASQGTITKSKSILVINNINFKDICLCQNVKDMRKKFSLATCQNIKNKRMVGNDICFKCIILHQNVKYLRIFCPVCENFNIKKCEFLYTV